MTQSRHIKQWAQSQLNLELDESHIGNLIDKNKFLAKLLTYSASHIKNKKYSQKYVNCATFSEIRDKIDDNNHQLGELYERSERGLSPAATLHERCLQLKRLFQYTFNQECFRVPQRFDRSKSIECHEISQKMLEILRQVEMCFQTLLSQKPNASSEASLSTTTRLVSHLEPSKHLAEFLDLIRSHTEIILRDLDKILDYDFMQKETCSKGLRENGLYDKTDNQLKEAITQLSTLLKNWTQLTSKIEQDRTNVSTYV